MENKIPSSLQVGGQNIKVNIVDRINNDRLGECCVAEARLDIAKNWGTRIQAETTQVNTFFHELTHCILDTMGEDDLSGNEKFVSTFSSFLCEAINSFKFDEKENGEQ